jgi:hypothetical protein
MLSTYNKRKREVAEKIKSQRSEVRTLVASGAAEGG